MGRGSMVSAGLALAFAVVPACAQPPPDPVIEAARKAAAGFAELLPDYIVIRTTTRYTGSRKTSKSPASDAGNWEKTDTVSAQIAAVRGAAEADTNITVNGSAAKKLPTGGAWSAGEFSSVLLDVLAEKSSAVFTNPRIESIANRLAYCYYFAIDHSHSGWDLVFKEGQGGTVIRYAPAFHGTIWIDGITRQVLRLERSAPATPAFFPVGASDSAIDYDFVTIGAEKYCLPIHAEDISCMQGGKRCFRNENIFRGYRKFRADTSVSFDGASK